LRSSLLLALTGLVGIALALTRATERAGASTAVLLVLPAWAFASSPSNSLAAHRAMQNSGTTPTAKDPETVDATR
jgi:hypothetical protein